MGRKPTEKEQQEFIQYLQAGRDEMNLLEHSISSASTKVDRTTRSLSFAKDDVDPESGNPVQRTWDVSFSKFGRPTAIDDDVFVACLKLSADDNFASRKVEFTRYEVCKILGWSDCGKSYRSIDEALRRLTGVYVAATNFWYDNKGKGWRDRNFHIFDSSEVFRREQYDQERRANDGKGPKSWFVWSETMKESFDAGYIRKLDLNEYLSLENPVARKLYRYLGKQFWFKTRHSIDLRTLCCEKLGYRSGTELNELRRKILPAIAQLEKHRCYGLSHEFASGYGRCEVLFNAKRSTKEDDKRERAIESPLIERLLECGVSRKDAVGAASRLGAERILEDIEHVEHETRAGRVKSSKAGMLATMLKSDEPWPRPQGFISSVEKARLKKVQAERTLFDEKRKAEAAVREAEQSERELAAYNAYMASLSEIEREQLKGDALRNGFWGKRYRDAVKGGDSSRIASALNDAMYATWRSQLKTAFGQGEAASLSEKSIG